MENNNENTTVQQEYYKDAHGSGFLSSAIFMVIAVVTMIVLRLCLNY